MADVVRPTNQYRGSIDPIPPPNPHNLGVCTPPLPSCMHHQKFPKFSKTPLFSRKCCFCSFCCFLSVANVVFQNLQNVEMLLPIFIFLIRRLVKKLFHFEVMFRSGVPLFIFTSLVLLASRRLRLKPSQRLNLAARYAAELVNVATSRRFVPQT